MTVEPEPVWAQIPSDAELLLARSVLKRMSYAIPVDDRELWGGLVEARRVLTIAVDYLAYYPGHKRRFRRLWHRMLEQDE